MTISRYTDLARGGGGRLRWCGKGGLLREPGGPVLDDDHGGAGLVAAFWLADEEAAAVAGFAFEAFGEFGFGSFDGAFAQLGEDFVGAELVARG